MGWLAILTLEDEWRHDLSLPRVVYEYEDVFLDELSGLLTDPLPSDRKSVGNSTVTSQPSSLD